MRPALPMMGVYVLFGAVVGVFSGLFGVGGGIIMIPFLVLVAGCSQQLAQGISLGVMVPAALANALRYARAGNFDVLTVFLLALGAVPAGYFLGADVAQRLPERTLKGLFATFMVLIAIRMMPAAGPRCVGSMGVLVGAVVIGAGVRIALAR